MTLIVLTLLFIIIIICYILFFVLIAYYYLKQFAIKGEIAPVFTPVDKDGKLVLSVIPEYLSFLKHNGVKGILGKWTLN